MGISTPPNYGNPDWQRGYYSAQKLLATVNAGVSSVVVPVPPNAETLVVIGTNLGNAPVVAAQGQQTGITYLGVPAISDASAPAAPTWFFDVSNTVDQTVKINWTVAPGAVWFVYADAGVHITVDASHLSTRQGVQWVSIAPPSIVQGDHPPNDLFYFGTTATVNSTFLPAPGAGSRYRVFAAWITTQGAGNAQMAEHGARWLVACAGNGANSVNFGPSGVGLGNNLGVDIFTPGGGISVGFGVSYTQEII